MADYIWHCWQIICAEYLFQAPTEAKCSLFFVAAAVADVVATS